MGAECKRDREKSFFCIRPVSWPLFLKENPKEVDLTVSLTTTTVWSCLIEKRITME